MNDTIDSNYLEKYQMPKWLKYFSILFAIIGLVIPIIIILNLLDFKPEIAIYGLGSNSIFDAMGIIILLVFIIKAIVSYGILRKEIWAFKLALFDGILGIVICISKFGLIDILSDRSNINFEFRLELLILIPYLIYIARNKLNWENQSK